MQIIEHKEHDFRAMRPGQHPHCSRCHVPQGSAEAAWIDGRCVEAQRGEPSLALLDELAAMTERASRLEDAAFHFQTCRVCRADGEFGRSTCLDGQMFGAFLRGEKEAGR